jgi:hypothetical protein
MDSIDRYTHSFIVKVWRERTGGKGEIYTWRGQISHVPDNERRSIRELGEIALFIAPYLLRMRVKLGWSYWLLWLLTPRRKPGKPAKGQGPDTEPRSQDDE